MSTRRNVLQERFFNALISGDRMEARCIVGEALDVDCSAEIISAHLFWPTVEMLQNLHRNDQLSELAYHYSTKIATRFG